MIGNVGYSLSILGYRSTAQRWSCRLLFGGRGPDRDIQKGDFTTATDTPYLISDFLVYVTSKVVKY